MKEMGTFPSRFEQKRTFQARGGENNVANGAPMEISAACPVGRSPLPLLLIMGLERGNWKVMNIAGDVFPQEF